MRYQQQQKGLFTFYKEQQLFEHQIELLKNKKKLEEQLKLDATKKNTSLNHNNSSKYSSPQKFKVTSQPAFDEDDSEHLKHRNKIKRIGDSIIIINRKQTQEREYQNNGREQSYQQKSKQAGHFIQNKNVEFQNLEKYKFSNPLLHKRKKSYLKKIDYNRPQDKQRRSTKLPTLMKVEEANMDEPEHTSNRARVNGSSLRYNGGDLMKYIRTNIRSEDQPHGLPQKSVSYIEFNRGYIKESSPKKLESLNEEQRRLLDILYRYRKSDK